MPVNFVFSDTKMDGVKLITPFMAEDERGMFLKYYEKNLYRENGIMLEPFEEMQSVSQKGVIRGMHFQKHHWQDKLVRVVQGSVYDVIVDLRRDSETFGQWEGFELSGVNKKVLYVPKGFAHGFLALEDGTIFCYCCGDQYDPGSDGGFYWNDPEIRIDWDKYKIGQYVVSQKDSGLPSFEEVKKKIYE